MNIHSIGMGHAAKENFGMAKAGSNMAELMNNARQYWANDCTYSNYVDYICDRIQRTAPEKTIEIQTRPDSFTRRIFDKKATCADVYIDSRRVGVVHNLNKEDPYIPLFNISRILEKSTYKD